METIRKVVGKVSPEENREIQALFERRNGLNELAKIVDVNDTELYEKLIKDLGETATKFQLWWNEKGRKYGWEGHPKGNWEIDFQTNEITLVVSED